MQAEDRDLAKQAETLQTRLAEEKGRQEGHREAIRKAVQALAEVSADWEAVAAGDAPSPDRLAALEQEKAALESAGATHALDRLTEARAKARGLAERIAGLKGQIDALPAAARRDPAEVERELADALASRSSRQEGLRTAEAAHQKLRDLRERRESLSAQFLQAERTHRRYKKLADLLGREQLQRHLLRQAEREIVQFANAVLDRVSGGDLLLRLRAAEADDEDGADGDADTASEKVLDLEAVHRRTAEGDAIPVAFLSGSQQFRVAVALALAFGQYAGGGNRLGECVIIDEGFGSLDRQGQAVMIEELQRLQSVMRRIILVSHQESFADAFPRGYRFSLKDGETKVERIES
jgi:DNA repair exonuclease SbcCD ATPase subunit